MEKMNPFEHLRLPGREDAEPIRKYKTIEVFSSSDELIRIYVAEAAPHSFAVGYEIYYNGGRHPQQLPSLESGEFKEEAHAILYLLAKIKMYPNLFSEEAIAAINAMIPKYINAQLF